MKCIKSGWKQKDVIHLNFYPHVIFESEHSMWVKTDSAALGELCGKQLASGFPTWSTYVTYGGFSIGFSTSDSKASRPLPAPPGCHSTVPNPFEDRRAQDIPRQMINTCRPSWSCWSGWRLQDPIPSFAAQTPVFVVLPHHFLWWIVPLFEWFAQCWVGSRYHHTFVRRAMTWTVGIKLYDMTDMAYQNLVGDWATLMKATCLPLWICWIIPTQTKRFLLAPTISLFWGTPNHVFLLPGGHVG